MEPTNVSNEELLFHQIAIAAHLLQPSSYTVSSCHLVVFCPVCNHPNLPADADLHQRISRDF